MNKISIIIPDMTLLALWEALSALSDEGAENDAVIDIEMTSSGSMLRVTAVLPPKHKGVKQRCATKDAQGRRCVRGPRHPEQHRYESGDSNE